MIRKAMVEGGTVVGIPAADPRITAFKGVPFAAPPVGENRWRAPQPVIPWEGERNCFTFAPISMQHIPGLDLNNIYSREWNVDPTIPMSEDCLYLNIWTPAKTADERLPVFVWYFGGGLKEGNTAEMEFDGERIARRGIVVVTVNYRVTAFGFLAHPELTAQQPDAPANFGHLDQRAGTAWVKRNIAAFGGDPDNITIGGQSAGGGSVCTQLTSPMNEGLFQRAVICSGMFGGVFAHPIVVEKTMAGAEAMGEKFFELLGVKTLEEARKLPAEFIRDKTEEFPYMFGTVPDGVFQIGDRQDNIMAGKHLRVPLFVTRTSGEFAAKCPPCKDMEEFRAVIRKHFGDRADEVLALCDPEDVEKAVDATAACTMEVPVWTLARKRKEHNVTEPVWYGVFDPSIPGWDDPGTFHSCDLWFWFETLAKCWRPFKGFHFDLARQMCNYLCDFIKTGDPNGDDHDGVPMPEWKPFSADETNVMWFRDGGSECFKDAPTPMVGIITDVYTDSLE